MTEVSVFSLPVSPESARHSYILLSQLAKAERAVRREMLGVYSLHQRVT